jgi:cytochrome c oxidase assembly protein subunit 15
MDAKSLASRRLSPRAFERLTLLTVIGLGLLILFGATVRLTGSGLGCSHWPACSSTHLVAPLSYHPVIEFLNRIVTGSVSVAMIVGALGALVRAPRRADLTVIAMGLAAGLVAEIVLGGVMVLHRLEPGFVMAHFLLSMVILWDAVVLHHRAGLPDGAPRRPLVDRDTVWVGRLMVAMVAATVIAGTIVTGSGPHSGAVAIDGTVERWQLSLHRVTQIHGTAAMLTLILVVATWWLLRSQQAPAEARRRLQQVVEALAIQVTIGYTQYFSGVPPLLVAGHVLGAVLVWTAALRFALVLSSGAAPAPPGPAEVGAGAPVAARSCSPTLVP